MNVLVTGGTGFLGSHLVRNLASSVGVVALEHDTHKLGPKLESHATARGDVTNLHFVERVIADYECHAVIHLAAQTQVSVGKADPAGTLDANVHGTWTVLEACRRQNVKRVIVASSDKAYGAGPTPYHEDQPLKAHGIYATSKACADFIAQAYAVEYGMSIAVTRCGNLYGPTNWSTLIPGTIKSILEGKRPVIRSDGLAKRDYLFVEDAVDGYRRLLGIDARGAFNFGAQRPLSVLDVVREIAAVMDSSLEPEILGLAKDEIAEQWLKADRAYDTLGWYAKHTLEAGLIKTIPWYREHLKP